MSFLTFDAFRPLVINNLDTFGYPFGCLRTLPPQRGNALSRWYVITSTILLPYSEGIETLNLLHRSVAQMPRCYTFDAFDPL
jgi:hypothetical protein